MISVTIDPVYIEVGLPALAIGLAVGVLVTWLVYRSKRKALAGEIAELEGHLKSQEALQTERETAFELANARLSKAFSDLAIAEHAGRQSDKQIEQVSAEPCVHNEASVGQIGR